MTPTIPSDWMVTSRRGTERAGQHAHQCLWKAERIREPAAGQDAMAQVSRELTGKILAELCGERTQLWAVPCWTPIRAGIPQVLSWDLSCFTPFSVTWRRQQKALQWGLQMTPSWQGDRLEKQTSMDAAGHRWEQSCAAS